MHTADRGGILLVSHDHADDNGFREYNDVRLLTMAVKFFSPGTQHWGEDATLGDTGFVWIADREGRFESDCVGGQEHEPITD